MRSSVASAALAAVFALAPLAAGCGAAAAQDFSITNPDAPPANTGHRDVVRQLQAWWDVHAYYPRHASQNDEGGTVKVHLLLYPDGRIWKVDVVGGSGSASIDTAAAAVFRGGFVQPFAEGSPDADIDLSLHYVLAHRHDQPVPVGYKPMAAKSPFTIMNDPVTSPILDTMLQKTCTGTVVRHGIRNHPAYGQHDAAEAVFFRKPDGTPWVKFYEGGFPILSPVTEVGKVVQWTGREEHLTSGIASYTHSTVWPDGANNLSGSLYTSYPYVSFANSNINNGGTVDFTCATETVPAITWSALAVTPAGAPPGDPP